MIEENVKKLLETIPNANPFGEKVTLVAAVKLQSPEDINRAICGGITDIGDNHVQEFKDKYDLIDGNPTRHFIGHLQTNKVKYLIGKVDLYHSLDRYALAEELSKRGEKAGVVSSVLLQINIGEEESKSGFLLSQANEAYAKIKAMPALKIKGLMAMLPDIDDQTELKRLALLRRRFAIPFNGNERRLAAVHRLRKQYDTAGNGNIRREKLRKSINKKASAIRLNKAYCGGNLFLPAT